MASEDSILNLQSLQVTAPLAPGEGVKTIVKRLARVAGFYALAAVTGAAAVILIAALLSALEYFQAAPRPAPEVGSALLWTLGITWAVFATALVILLIYRSTLTMQEEDQLFLDEADSLMEHEQVELLVNVNHVTTFAKYAGLATGTLTLALLFVFVYYGPAIAW